MVKMPTLKKDSYELLDSGAEKRIERFGTKLIIRPYKRALWRPEKPLSHWQKSADAEYCPDKKGWKQKTKLEEWECKTSLGLFALRLQKSSQVGLFPEHMTYLPELFEETSSPLKVLNLFAYTGAATVFASRLGHQVTHVDISGSCLDWTSRNLALNTSEKEKQAVSFIKEDAISYLEKLVRRETKFDLIIADPPSFSRPSKKKTWQAQEVIDELIETSSKVLSPGGKLCLTSHQLELDHFTLANMVKQNSGSRNIVDLKNRSLTLEESGRGFQLESGSLVIAKFD